MSTGESVPRKRGRKRLVLAALIVGTLVLAVKGRDGIACSLAANNALKLADGELVTLMDAANERVAALYGPTQADFNVTDARSSWSRLLYGTVSHGKTVFTPLQTCLLVGAEGRNVDVVAHELVHVELADRLGYAKRMLSMPVWFDEGLAMQVDHRPRYNIGNFAGLPALQLEALATPGGFFAADDQQLTYHYAYAKAVVQRWLQGPIGPLEVFDAMSDVRRGKAMDNVLGQPQI